MKLLVLCVVVILCTGCAPKNPVNVPGVGIDPTPVTWKQEYSSTIATMTDDVGYAYVLYYEGEILTLVKLNFDGAAAWRLKDFPNIKLEYYNTKLLTDSLGNIYISGKYRPSSDLSEYELYHAKILSSGVLSWQNTIVFPDPASILGVPTVVLSSVISSASVLYVAYSFESELNVITFDTAGTLTKLYTKDFSPAELSYGLELTMGMESNLYLFVDPYDEWDRP